MEIASGPSEENKKDENMEELDKPMLNLAMMMHGVRES